MVFARRGGARGCPCGGTSLGTNKAAYEGLPGSGGTGPFFLFWQFAKAPAKLWQKRSLSCSGHTMFQDFIGCHDGSPRFHHPAVLAIVGGTRLGKSMLAADILDRIVCRLGLPGFCMVFGGGHSQKRTGLQTQRLTIAFFKIFKF